MSPDTGMNKDSGGIEVIVEDENWLEALPEASALAASCFAAVSQAEPSLQGEAALLLTDDAAVQALNAQFRGRDKPTNVLAFPGGGPAHDGEVAFLGDIAIARETCLQEAAARGIAPGDHAAHLIVHGLLHLIGYDHQAVGEALVMERLETAILNRLNIADPYSDEVTASDLPSGNMETI